MTLPYIVFELDNLGFYYPHEEPVLKEISFNVTQGESICILGVNGSGKSTLLKLLSGLIHPKTGIFKAFGRVMTDKIFNDETFLKEYHKKVGFIFQNSDVQLFCSTVKDEIAFGPLQLNLEHSLILHRVKDVMKLLGLESLAEKAPFKLSGGEKKKVALASVLVMNPDVLILDEPTNGLDPRTQRWLVELLVSLNKAGKTIITSTHNLELVHEISERVLVFDEKHRIALDSPTGPALENTELLGRVNLIDEYYHRHGEGPHTHFHLHS